MLKKCLVVIAFIIITISVSSCGSNSNKTSLETKGKTSQDTPIVDEEKSSFDVDCVNMRNTPDSSCFSKIGYDSDFNALVVTFRDSGDTYIYTDFPDSQWKSFSSADSLGSFYNEKIKGNYDCYKYD